MDLAACIDAPVTLAPLERALRDLLGETRLGDGGIATGLAIVLKRLDTGDCVVDGAMTIRDFNRATDWSLPDDEANTVAGLVIHEAQTIPTEGQAFNFHGYRFEILSRKENRLTRLKIRPV